MHMDKSKKWLSFLAITAIATIGFSTSAIAVSSGDVATTVTEPETDAEVQAGDFLSNGVSYTLELENTGENDTEVDTEVTVTHEGTTESVTVNDTSVDAGETVTYRGSVPVDAFDLSESGNDATLQADSTYTDEEDSSTASSSDSVSFELYQSTAFQTVLGMLVLVAIVGVFTREL